jgi:hypothetical protein
MGCWFPRTLGPGKPPEILENHAENKLFSLGCWWFPAGLGPQKLSDILENPSENLSVFIEHLEQTTLCSWRFMKASDASMKLFMDLLRL